MEQSLSEAPIVNIVGETVALGPVRRDLLPLYQRWVNDFSVTRWMDIGMRPMTLESEVEWYERASRSTADAHFTIYQRSSMRAIGTGALLHIDHINRTAELGIVIGEPSYWGKGYGTAAVHLMLGYGFQNLGLHNIMLRTYGDNERAVRAYTKAGFKLIGRRRQAVRRGGGVADLLYMDCLASEFEVPGPGAG